MCGVGRPSHNEEIAEDDGRLQTARGEGWEIHLGDGGFEKAGELCTGMFGAVAESREIDKNARVARATGEHTIRSQLTEHEEVIELVGQVLVNLVGDATDGEKIGLPRGADGGDGAGFHVNGESASGPAKARLVGGPQYHLIGRHQFAVMDTNLPQITAIQASGVGRLVGRIPCDLVALILAQFQNLGADDDVAGPGVPLESPAKTGADNQIRTVTANGHFSGDAGAFLANAERQQGNRLSAESALMKIEVFLADDMVRVRTMQNGLKLLANCNEDRDHGSFSGVRRDECCETGHSMGRARWPTAPSWNGGRLGEPSLPTTLQMKRLIPLAAATAVVMVVGGGRYGCGDFPVGKRLLDVGLHGITFASEVTTTRGDTIIGVHM
jgi:hypothetical protein